MKAMWIEKLTSVMENPEPLTLKEVEQPKPGEGEILIRISACGVCHTELDEIEGRTPPPKLPIIPGHQVVGRVVQCGKQAKRFAVDDRVGVAWIFEACGKCEFCLRGEENLCADFRATGRDANGGYAEYMVVKEKFAYAIPDEIGDYEAAPLLCAGAIGYRSLMLSNIQDGDRLGLTGFGASAHLVLMMTQALYPQTKVYVFSRSDNEQEFARQLGAVWAGHTEERAPELLHAIIDTTPVWKPVMEGMKNLAPGGRMVINAIRKENVDRHLLAEMDYPSQLWMEKEIKSVANVTRRDVEECLKLAAKIGIKPAVQMYSLEQANRALWELKNRKIRGAKVIRV